MGETTRPSQQLNQTFTSFKSIQSIALALKLWDNSLHTCILVILSESSSLCRSLSPNLTCSSWTWASAFLRRCSDSPLLCVKVFISICSSFHSLSRACLAFSTDTLFCRTEAHKTYYWWYSAIWWPSSSNCSSHYLFGLLQLLIEFIKCLIVFLSHVSHLLLMALGLFFQGLLQLSNLRLTLGPAWIKNKLQEEDVKMCPSLNNTW